MLNVLDSVELPPGDGVKSPLKCHTVEMKSPNSNNLWNHHVGCGKTRNKPKCLGKECALNLLSCALCKELLW